MSEDSEDDDDSFQPVDGTRRILPSNLMPPPNLPGRADAFYVDSSDNELDEEKELPTLDMDESKDKAVAPKAVVIYHQDNQGVDMALVRYVPPDGVLPKSCSDHEMKRVITPEIVPRGAKACDFLITYKLPKALYNFAEESKDTIWDDIWGESATEARAAMKTKERDIRKEHQLKNGTVMCQECVPLTVKVSTVEKWFVHPCNSQAVNFALRGPETEEMVKKRNVHTIYGPSST